MKAKVARGTVKDNMGLIFKDLDMGTALMENAQDKEMSRVKINLAAAYGLKSRIALFFAHYDHTLYDVVAQNATKAIALAQGMQVSVISRAIFLDSYKLEDVSSNSIFELAQSGISNSRSNSLYSIYNKLETGGPYGDI